MDGQRIRALVYLWTVARRRWWLPTIIVLLASGGGLAIDKRTTPVYQTSTRLFIYQVHAPGPPSYDDTLASQSLATTYTQIVHSPSVLQDAIDALHLTLTPQGLDRMLTARPVRQTPLLDIAVQDTDPARAAHLADAVARALIAYVEGLQVTPMREAGLRIDRQIGSARQAVTAAAGRLDRQRATRSPAARTPARVGSLQAALVRARAHLAVLLDARRRLAPAPAPFVPTVMTLSPAPVPTVPVHPQPLLTLALAAVAGLLVALGLVVLFDRLDDRLRAPEDLVRRFGLAPLAVLGGARGARPRGRAGATAPGSDPTSDSLLLARATLDAALPQGSAVVCVTSAGPSEGKSMIAARLALLEAQTGKRVVLIDANLRAPHLHRSFDAPNDRGLSTVLADGEPLVDPPLRDGPLAIKILTAGPIPIDPAGLLASRRMGELVALLRTHADIIIVDTPPLASCPDALLLQRVVDRTVLVMDPHRTRMGTMGEAVSALQRASGAVVGVIVNRRGRRAATRGGMSEGPEMWSRRAIDVSHPPMDPRWEVAHGE